MSDDETGVFVLPDGSAFAAAEFPLPNDHWVYDEADTVPPMPFRMGTDDRRRCRFAELITAAARYAVRASTMKGKSNGFDPDAMVQNLVVGVLGYHTPDGLCGESWADPDPAPEPVPQDSTPPLQAIRFALDHCGTDDQAMSFLRAWNEGNIDEWPDYKAFLQADG